jgi:hypothetical protein
MDYHNLQFAPNGPSYPILRKRNICAIFALWQGPNIVRINMAGAVRLAVSQLMNLSWLGCSFESDC